MEHATLWSLYRETGDLTARDTLVQESLDLVHWIARKMRKQLGDLYDHSDLVSAGTVGLLEAVSAFDPARGFSFSTFAAQRIRGAILDDLRARDPLSREARRRCRRLAEAEQAVERRLGRSPTAVEVAAELDVSLETYWQWRAYAEFEAQTPLEAPQPGRPDVARTVGAPSDIEEALEREDRVEMLRDGLLSLTEQERVVISLYYYEELTQSEIASVLELTEARISQIRAKAIKKLRGRMTSMPMEASAWG